MRPSYRNNPEKTKQIARNRYADRQIDKFVKWSWKNRGLVRYKELIELQDKFKIKCYTK